MTIEQLGSIGELLAAIATMATLIYLAIQIRGSNASTRAEARRSMDIDSHETIRKIAGDPDVAGMFMKGLVEPEALKPEDSFRFTLLMSHFFSLQDTSWKEVRLGTMSEQELKESIGRSRPFLESRGGVWWWGGNSKVYPKDFREFFEAEIPRLKASGGAARASESRVSS
jgi:hypothetical protein